MKIPIFNTDKEIWDTALQTIITLNNYIEMQAQMIEIKDKLTKELADELENISIMLPEENKTRIKNLVEKIPF
jgi:hypothetical protein